MRKTAENPIFFTLFPLTGLTVEAEISTFKEEQDILLTFTHFSAIPEYLLLGTNH